jgi:hypothetical protein
MAVPLYCRAVPQLSLGKGGTLTSPVMTSFCEYIHLSPPPLLGDTLMGSRRLLGTLQVGVRSFLFNNLLVLFRSMDK